MIVLEANTKKASMYEQFLEKVQLLEPLTKDQRNKMVDALEGMTWVTQRGTWTASRAKHALMPCAPS